MTTQSAPSFCWHCGGALKSSVFELVKDQLGNQHRVHKVCQEPAEDECRVITACASDIPDLRDEQ